MEAVRDRVRRIPGEAMQVEEEKTNAGLEGSSRPGGLEKYPGAHHDWSEMVEERVRGDKIRKIKGRRNR